MKKFITTLLLITSSHAFASGLELVHTPDLSASVERIYDKGRNMADQGGIREIKVFKNTGNLQTFFIVKEVMKQDDIALSACWEFGEEATNECVRRVLMRDEEVMANNQVNHEMDWLGELSGWDLGDEWQADLKNVYENIKLHIGANPKGFAYGYDYVADVWTIILISEDKETVMMISSDFGA